MCNSPDRLLQPDVNCGAATPSTAVTQLHPRWVRVNSGIPAFDDEVDDLRNQTTDLGGNGYLVEVDERLRVATAGQ